MNTYEMTKKNGRHYELNYVFPIDAYGHQHFYFQIERISDGAILFANENQTTCMMEAWKMGIKYDDIAIY